MVRYYGRARQRLGSVNTNQPGLKQAGCPGTVGKQGLIIQHLGKRVNCNLKTCGLPMSGLRCRYGVADAIGRDKTFMDIQNSNNPAIKDYCKQVVGGQNGVYCQWPQPRNRQNAGGVGNIWTSRRNHCEKTCSLGWKENYMSNHTPKELAGGKPWRCVGTCMTVGSSSSASTAATCGEVYGYSGSDPFAMGCVFGSFHGKVNGVTVEGLTSDGTNSGTLLYVGGNLDPQFLKSIRLFDGASNATILIPLQSGVPTPWAPPVTTTFTASANGSAVFDFLKARAPPLAECVAHGGGFRCSGLGKTLQVTWT